MPRTNFTDAQKAEIFVRDKATCAFSGTNLWLLDFGASGNYQIDWADHVKPSSGGGLSAVDNGVCASWLYNYNKSDSPYPGVQLFSNGVPTPHFFRLHGQVTELFVTRHGRSSKLHISDWSFNRAIWLVCMGVCWLSDSKQQSVRTRDYLYYAKAALKRISSWRVIVRQSSVASLEKRGLTPKPLQADQRLLLSVREANSVEEITDAMKQLLPYHEANSAAFEEFMAQIYEKDDEGARKSFLRNLKVNRYVTPVVRQQIVANARIILAG